jgi:hypothetical protein
VQCSAQPEGEEKLMGMVRKTEKHKAAAKIIRMTSNNEKCWIYGCLHSTLKNIRKRQTTREPLDAELTLSLAVAEECLKKSRPYVQNGAPEKG